MHSEGPAWWAEPCNAFCGGPERASFLQEPQHWHQAPPPPLPACSGRWAVLLVCTHEGPGRGGCRPEVLQLLGGGGGTRSCSLSHTACFTFPPHPALLVVEPRDFKHFPHPPHRPPGHPACQSPSPLPKLNSSSPGPTPRSPKIPLRAVTSAKPLERRHNSCPSSSTQ